MNRRSATAVPEAPDTRHRDRLLDRLGLGPKASNQDVELAHERLTDFLQLAPGPLRGWARARLAEVDEAYAVLINPDADPQPEPSSAGPDTPAGRPGRTAAPAPARPAGARAPAVTEPAGAPRQRALWVVVFALVTALVIVGVYTMGRTSDVPEMSGQGGGQSTAAPTATVDQAQIMQLMQKISSNPRDVAALASLADIYFQAGDYSTASDWQRKILAVDPKNELARLGLGAALFNLGNLAEAEKLWLAVVAANPRQIEAHYDLGFLYMKKSPPDPERMRQEWAKVVEIDPNSEYAKSVSTHLTKVDSSTPTTSPTTGRG